MSLSLTPKLFVRISLFGTLTVLASACSSLTPAAIAAQPVVEAPRVALVLGGGGTKGFAHVGVIKALEQNGITPDLIVGTSIGSLVGSLYASGYDAAQLERLALTTADSELLDFTLSNQGFVEGVKLKNFINTKVGNRSIEDFPIRFAAVAAEQQSLKKTVFTEGNTGLIVQASCSIPGIFIAPRIPEKSGKKYVDGGVVSLVPVDSARDLGADIIIAVDVTAIDRQSATSSDNQRSPINTLSSFWGLLEYSVVTNINTTANAKAVKATSLAQNNELQRADIIITPNISHISSFDSSQRRALIDAGAQATVSQMPKIKQLIKEKYSSKYATL